MVKATYAIKIELELAAQVKKFCQKRGINQNRFVKKALREQLAREEALEDMLELKSLKHQEKSAISFEDYLKKR